MNQHLENVAAALVGYGKGILAADETVPTLTKRFDTLGIQSTEESRRTYREKLFSATGAAEFISGVIMADETIRQKSSGGMPFAEFLLKQGILPGVTVDTGAKALAGSSGESVIERAGWSRGPPLHLSRHGCALCQVAGRYLHHGQVAELGVRERNRRGWHDD